MNQQKQRPTVSCPDCKCTVRADHIEKHRRKAHGWQSEEEIKTALRLAQKQKVAAVALGKKVTEEARQFVLRHKLKASLYWAKLKQLKKRPKQKQSKIRRNGKWRKRKAVATPVKGGMPPLIYSGAFEMNRRKH